MNSDQPTTYDQIAAVNLYQSRVHYRDPPAILKDCLAIAAGADRTIADLRETVRKVTDQGNVLAREVLTLTEERDEARAIGKKHLRKALQQRDELAAELDEERRMFALSSQQADQWREDLAAARARIADLEARLREGCGYISGYLEGCDHDVGICECGLKSYLADCEDILPKDT